MLYLKKKILITGSEGFLGNHLKNYLSKKNYLIYCLQKKKVKYKNLNNIKYLQCDIKNKNLLKKFILAIKPHYVFHLAAKSHPSFSFKKPIETLITNAIGTANLLNSIFESKLNPKIVIACSSAQYGTRTFNELPLKENDGFVPDHIYGLSKYFQGSLGRQYVKMFNLKKKKSLAPPAVAALEARHEGSHGFVRRPRLRLRIGALAHLAFPAHELVGGDGRSLFVIVRILLLFHDMAPLFRRHLLVGHESDLVGGAGIHDHGVAPNVEVDRLQDREVDVDEFGVVPFLDDHALVARLDGRVEDAPL